MWKGGWYKLLLYVAERKSNLNGTSLEVKRRITKIFLPGVLSQRPDNIFYVVQISLVSDGRLL